MCLVSRTEADKRSETRASGARQIAKNHRQGFATDAQQRLSSAPWQTDWVRVQQTSGGLFCEEPIIGYSVTPYDVEYLWVGSSHQRFFFSQCSTWSISFSCSDLGWMDASISYADSPVLYSIIRAQAEQMPMHVREVPNFGSSYYDNYLYLCFLVVFHFSWCVIVKDKKMQITLLHADSSRILLPVPVVVDAAASICLQRHTEGRNPLLMSADLQPTEKRHA